MGRKQLLVGTAILAGANILTKCMGFFTESSCPTISAQKAWGCIN